MSLPSGQWGQQVLALVIHEFRRTLRRKGIIFIVFILPLLIWVIITGFIYASINEPVTYEGNTVYFMNFDEGSPEVNMGEIFMDILQQRIELEDSILHGVNLEQLEPLDTENGVITVLRDRGQSPSLVIPSNFSAVYLAYESDQSDIPQLGLMYLPSDEDFMRVVRDQAFQILYQPPFSIVEFETQTIVRLEIYTDDGELMKDPVSSWQISFFGLYVALFAPGPIISGFFAKEREKQTLESILVLPMTEFQILIGKYLAGGILLWIFSYMNILGVLLYSLLTQNIEMFSYSEFVIFELGVLDSIFFSTIIFITSLTALALGISITHKMKESQAVETTYNLVVVLPYAVIALVFLIMENPPIWIYVIPWANSGAMVMKAFFPAVFITEKITNSWEMDVVLHGLILLLFNLAAIIATMIIAKYRSIFSLGGD